MKTPLVVAAFALLFACEKNQNPPTETPEQPGEGSAGSAGETPPPPAQAECKPTGCSGTVCSDQDVVTTCEFRPEYACYKTATCARQEDGNCGWTKSAELDACLANPPAE